MVAAMLRLMSALGLVLICASACEKAPKPDEPKASRPSQPRTPGYEIDELIVQADRLEYRAHESWRGGPVEITRERERRISGQEDIVKRCDGEVYVRESVSGVGKKDPFVSQTYSCRDAKGMGHFAGIYPGQGKRHVYEIKYELLSKTRVGQAWSGEHGEGEEKNQRSCRVEESRYCEKGVATVCVTERTQDRFIWLRHHYCVGQGWRGHDALMLAGNELIMRGWSSDVVVDGTAYPDAEAPMDLPDLAGVREEAAKIRKMVEAQNSR